MTFDFFDPAMSMVQPDPSGIGIPSMPEVVMLSDVDILQADPRSFEETFANAMAEVEATILPSLDRLFVSPMEGDGAVDDGEGGVIITGPVRLVRFVTVYVDGGGGGGGGGGGTGAGGAGSEVEVPPWTDPQQPTRNACANPAIRIDVSGTNVTITGVIRFEGAGADVGTVNQLLTSLNSTWSGPFNSYTVSTNMTIGTGGLVANVSGLSQGQPSTLGLAGSVINTFTLNEVEEIDAKFTLNSFAHEFGHTLGLMDLYDTRGTKGWAPGYEPNVMSSSASLPNWQNIRDLIAKKAKGCSTST